MATCRARPRYGAAQCAVRPTTLPPEAKTLRKIVASLSLESRDQRIGVSEVIRNDVFGLGRTLVHEHEARNQRRQFGACLKQRPETSNQGLWTVRSASRFFFNFLSTSTSQETSTRHIARRKRGRPAETSSVDSSPVDRESRSWTVRVTANGFRSSLKIPLGPAPGRPNQLGRQPEREPLRHRTTGRTLASADARVCNRHRRATLVPVFQAQARFLPDRVGAGNRPVHDVAIQLQALDVE